MWQLDHKESWVPKNWCFWTVVLEKTLESPLDCKEIKAVNPKGNQPWILTGRTDAEAEAPILWLPDVKNWLIGKDPGARKCWRQEEKGMTEDEMVGWYHRLNGHEFEQALGAGDGQGSLACCSPWGHKESETTEWLNWTELTHCEVVTSVCGGDGDIWTNVLVPLWAWHSSRLQKLQKLYLRTSRSALGAEMSGLLREFLLVPYLLSVFCHIWLCVYWD